MNEFLKMDVFFVVATAATVVVAFFVVLVLWRFGRLLKHLEKISEQAERESDAIRRDLAEMRRDIVRGEGRLWSFLGFAKKNRQTKE